MSDQPFSDQPPPQPPPPPPALPPAASGSVTVDGTVVPVHVSAATIPWHHRGWAKALAGLVLLVSGMAIGLTANHLQAPAPAAPSPDMVRQLTEQMARNDALRQAVGDLEAALAGDVCALDPAALRDLRRHGPVGGTGAAGGAGTSHDGDEAGSSQAAGPLAERLERATVIVLGDEASGSGFFIAPDRIVTNGHVVDGAAPGSLRVTSRAMGKVVAAEVMAMEHAEDVGDMDFALLKVPAQATAQPLALSTAIAKLVPVVAAGYPGIYLEVDAQFADGGIPELVLQRGEISVIQEYTPGIPAISHTASIFQGNSGGPLVDACGRVVGINTFVLRTADGDTPAQIGYSLGTQALLTFLGRHGAAGTATASHEPCATP